MSADAGAPTGAAAAAPARVTLPVTIGRVLFNIRNALFPVAFIVFALASRPRYPLDSARWNLALDLLGLGVAFAGQALRVAVIGLDYIQRGGKNRQIHADHLVTGGFFAHSRNPLYLGNMMIYFGLFLVLNSPAGYLLGVPFFLGAYLCITAAEEEYLSRTFGSEYKAYRARVPRFWPRWSGLGATMRGMTFNWRRVVRKEYGTTFSWLTTAIALLCWQALRNESADAARATLLMAVAWWTPVVLAYFAARIMKKSGALQST